MKKDHAPGSAEAEKEEAGKPSLLLTKKEAYAPPKQLEYKPGQAIKQICSAKPRMLDALRSVK